MAPCYGWRSPHTRGARGQALRRLGPRRIIPAYAGSTGPPPAETQRRLHHPRIRGEHDVFADQVAQTKGSSPHTRGALVMVTHTFYYIRIIPAYAGSTGPPPAETQRRLHHPRIRGEHDFARSKTSRRDQSSPHTRGARAGGGDAPAVGRIIPAYAGSTGTAPSGLGNSGDHPRIRGEHLNNGAAHRVAQGSSPHTRGAQGDGRRPRRRIGIIPAYAGSTSMCPTCCCGRGDHPRIRGEHSEMWRTTHRSGGSSPHTRGAPAPSGHRSWLWRIIPAYAGSTCRSP